MEMIGKIGLGSCLLFGDKEYLCTHTRAGILDFM